MRVKLYKNDNGITLTALIITVIVMLVVSGVAIASITGQEGLIAKVRNAKMVATLKNKQEAIDIFMLNYLGADKKDVDIEEIINKLLECEIIKDEELSQSYTEEGTQNLVIPTQDNCLIIIHPDGNIEVVDKNSINIVPSNYTSSLDTNNNSILISINSDVASEGTQVLYQYKLDNGEWLPAGGSSSEKYVFTDLIADKEYLVYARILGEDGKIISVNNSPSKIKVIGINGDLNISRDITEPTSGNVIVTLSTNTDYQIIYNIGTTEGEWQLYNEPIPVSSNCTVYARLSNNIAKGKIHHLVIDNIGVAKIGNKAYSTLPLAVNAANDNDVITLIDNTTISQHLIINKDLTLDIKGYTISATNGSVVANKNLTINALPQGKITNSNSIAVRNLSSGTLIINNGNYLSTATHAIYNDAGGTVIVNGGKIENSSNYATVYNNATGIINLAGGEIKANSNSAVAINNSGGTVEVCGATILNVVSGMPLIYNNLSGNIKISSGKLLGTDVIAIYNNDSGEVLISGGEIKSNNRVIENIANGKIKVTGGTIDGSSDTHITLLNRGNGLVEVTGGNINAEVKQSILNYSDGTVNISGGNIKSMLSNTVYNNGNGNVNISGNAKIEGFSSSFSTVINQSTGRITVNDGIITNVNCMCISNNLTGTVEINGGNIQTSTHIAISNISQSGVGNIVINGGTVKSVSGHAVKNEGIGNVTINGGTVQVDNGTYAALYNSLTGNIIVRSGVIKHTTANALYNAGTGSVTLGVNDGVINSNSPELSSVNGYNTVVSKQGTLNYYDGVIRGGGISATNVVVPTGKTYSRDTSTTPYYTTLLK